MAIDKAKRTLVAILAVAISIFHYATKMDQLYFHTFFLELYFLPLILGGFWFGLKGGIVTSLGITFLYIPEIILEWQGLSPEDFDRILEVLLFNIVAAGLGYIRDREKAQEKARLEAEYAAKEQAESVSRLKSDFLTLVSHELRTPLISIIGYNDLLLDGVAGKLTEEQIDALKKINQNSKKLLELITAMLDLSHLEAKSLELKEVSVPDLIEEVKSEMKSLIETSPLEFVCNAEPTLPPLLTDPSKLKIVLKNLISNALKFTLKGSITIDVHRKDSGVEISVRDTGIGIAPEELQIIFEPFRQVENPLIRQHGGAGLGLYIVKRLIKILAGTIKIESEINKGSTFSIWLPTVRV